MKIDKKKIELKAVKLLRESNIGILSTNSAKFENYPFGSLVSYSTSRSRSIYLYISTLAQHTKNIKNSNKVCLTITNINHSGDKQDSARLSLLGKVDLVKDDEIKYCEQSYYSLIPNSINYKKMHDFSFYKISIDSIRWIGGFGEISWLKKDNWLEHTPDWKERENMIIDHMNSDHSDSISHSLKMQYGISDKSAKMAFLNIDGYYVKSRGKFYFIKFEKTCMNSKEYKEELVRLARIKR